MKTIVINKNVVIKVSATSYSYYYNLLKNR